MTRELPKVDIRGVRFFVDIRKDEFVQIDNVDNVISFDTFKNQLGSTHSYFFYDLVKGCAVDQEYPPGPLPKGIVRVKVPSLMVLDPIGLARLTGERDDAFKRQVVPQKLHFLETSDFVRGDQVARANMTDRRSKKVKNLKK